MKPKTLPRIAPRVAGEIPWEAFVDVAVGAEDGVVEEGEVEDGGEVIDEEVSVGDEGVAEGVGVGVDWGMVEGGDVRPP